MGDRWAVALAVAVAVGASRPGPVPVGLALAALAGALLVRRPALLCLGAALLASSLAQRALDGLGGLETGPVAAAVTLLTDPEPSPGGVRAEARLGRHRVELVVPRSQGRALVDALAGERLVVRGDVAPLTRPSAWSRSRHLAGRLSVHRWKPGPPADPLSAAANRLRRSLVAGAEPLGERRAALLTGLVVGDDRHQPVDLADDFQGAGLTHLLAVSGQNVAFVLVLVAPVTRRLRLWPRWAATLAVIGSFGLLTRFEPSVTRAAAMAALAATTTTVARPVTRLRLLALAVAGLLLVDPLLVGSLGFRLSVAAVLAIVVAAEPIAAALPGPRWLADAVAVTAAAQVGVAPLLLAAFGPLPLASLPANLLAVPAAGLVMVWGMTAGVLAGWVPPGWAEVLHQPTRALLWWVEEVAARASAAPLGRLGAGEVAAIAAGFGAMVLGRRRRTGALRAAGGVVVVGAVVVALVAAQAPSALREALAPGVVRWHSGGTEVLALGGGGWQRRVGAADVLAALRPAHVGAVDLVVVLDADVPASAVAAIARRHPIGAVVVPAASDPADRPPGAVVAPPTGTVVRVGALLVLVTPGERRLVVEAWPAPG